ncbi:cell cycle checkpoint protein rad17 [Colletotrichum karsti]|uniref:Cell cycle checkpoint protein rad17 n=1 Tax=Colletotrichum karsti TaxID=1095194 RepID=A0A9P6IEP0_9PEZI|nr:cell cycle checkpoint protein rad17 [Colletotrichum karsti]KAF9879126.1 cell cycle checkpoint protein rad17 [Colletotrichum karsti]
MAPPAKRRRRNVVVESDDEVDEKPKTNTLANYLFSSPDSKSASRNATDSPSPTKTRSRAAEPKKSAPAPNVLQARNGQSNKATKSPSTSPEKPKAKGQKRVKIEEKGRNGDLKTLFSKQAQRTTARPTSSSRTIPLDDIVSDPISDDDFADQKASTSSIVGQNARKRFRDNTPTSTASFGSSQKFLKPARPTAPVAFDDDLRPWSERFGPVNLDELAVHKRKVADVRKWLDDVVGGRLRQRLLLLKGAAGSGKTTTMRLLAKDMGAELLEWRNPTSANGANLGYSSASSQFQEFLGRGGKFGQLDLDLTAEAPRPKSEVPDPSSQKIILVEEFPNTFSKSSTALTSFRKSLLEYLAANTPSLTAFGRRSSNEPITPVVLVISETLLTTTSASADSFTAHRLLGPEILRHPGTRIIEFNPIAPTILAKALEGVVLKEARKSGRKRTPGPQVLKRLGEIGDIRSAISSLEWMCLKGDQDADWGAKVALKQTKAAKAGIALTRGEQDTLELISQREASLGIFHAVGKVVYNKREEAPATNAAEELPSYLEHYSRPKPSEVKVDTLIDETGTDTQTFISALHENYMFSCETVPPMDASTPLDYVNGCIEYISESDLLCPSSDIFFGGRGAYAGFSRDTGSHVLRQDEIAFQVAVRGMLFSLPSPVKRKASTGAKGGDQFKMFYPTSIKLWRQKEEFESLVDFWSTKLMKGEETAPRKGLLENANAFRRPKQTDVGSWMAKRQSKPAPTIETKPETDSTPLLSLGSSARREMLLERLPYMAAIVRGRKSTLHSFKLRDLEKVVSFQGIGPPTADDDEAEEAPEDDVMTGDAWATDKPSEEMTPRKKGASIEHRGDGSVAGLQVQDLVISDDDIEDD